ncbi:MAG: SBBP repeat-containing protein [Xanthomonadaceae bacterium]|nr:SBBP repeat-containing protein [Xanthomonadaceae bacterium]
MTTGVISPATILAAGGGQEIFVSKVDSSGTVLWTTQFGGGANDVAKGIALDSELNVYIAGKISGFPGSYCNSSNIRVGLTDSFLMKLANSNGQCAWIRNWGIPFQTSWANAIAIDRNNSIYVAGETNYFGTGNCMINSMCSGIAQNSYIKKFHKNGTTSIYGLWNGPINTGGLEVGSFGAATSRITGIVIDSNLDVIVSGTTTGAYFGYSLMGGQDIFLLKISGYDASTIWVRQYGGANTDEITDLAIDSKDNVYFVGSIKSSSFWGPVYGLTDGYIAKVTTAGDFCWVYKYGSAVNDFYLNVNIDYQDNIYIYGITMGGYANPSLIGINQDIIFIKMDSNKNVFWSKQIGEAGKYQNQIIDSSGLSSDIYGYVTYAGDTFGNTVGGNGFLTRVKFD